MKKTQRTNKNRTGKGEILALIKTLKPGNFFYTDQSSKIVQRYSVLYGVKIKTEIHYSVNPKLVKVEKLNKVTIL